MVSFLHLSVGSIILMSTLVAQYQCHFLDHFVKLEDNQHCDHDHLNHLAQMHRWLVLRESLF